MQVAERISRLGTETAFAISADCRTIPSGASPIAMKTESPSKSAQITAGTMTAAYFSFSFAFSFRSASMSTGV